LLSDSSSSPQRQIPKKQAAPPLGKMADFSSKYQNKKRKREDIEESLSEDDEQEESHFDKIQNYGQNNKSNKNSSGTTSGMAVQRKEQVKKRRVSVPKD
jgi:hypothetical protein